MITQKDINRFHTKYVMEPLSGCWLWTDVLLKGGYGKIEGKCGRYYAHRFSAMIHGLDMSKPVVRHLCNNPSCVNPAHLETGTAQDNSDDKIKANRQPRGQTNGQAKLTEAEVLEIRRLYAEGLCTKAALGRKYNVTPELIGLIISRKKWRHI